MPAHGAGVRGRRGNAPSELPRPGQRRLRPGCGRSARPARAAGASANDGGDVCSCNIAQVAARWAAAHAPGAGAPPASDGEQEAERARKLLARLSKGDPTPFLASPRRESRPPPSFHGTAAGRRVAALVPAASTPPTADREEESLRECREGALFAPLLQATSLLALPRSCVPALVL